MKKVLFITDPVSTFNPEAETTSFLAFEAQRRKFKICFCELSDMHLSSQRLILTYSSVTIKKKKKEFQYTVGHKKRGSLSDFDFVFIRKDPPINQAYIQHLQILALEEERLKDSHIQFINSPSGILKANEKILPSLYGNLTPDSIVSLSSEEILQFSKRYSKVVLKPLNEAGGRGIVLIESRSPSLKSVIELVSQNGSEFIVAQQYLPQIKKTGDKRILLWDGQILGAFVRIPSSQDFRGNMHSGASWAKSVITPKEKKIVTQLSEYLVNNKLRFVGIDIIGERLTEVNTTSPMGIRELNHLDNSQIERVIWGVLAP